MTDAGPDAALLRSARLAFDNDPPARIGLAVSGGGDSVAALHLMAQVYGPSVRAVTVDHRLRPEAAEEVRFVAALCAGLGVPHEGLVWDHGAITGNLQDQARRARYGLMAGWARRQGISAMVLAHTADDQAETLLMGLARGAGIDGLSGMRPLWHEGNLRWHRPFLSHSRQELRAYLQRHGLDWRDDPSNENDRFTRVKARRALQALAPLGLTVGRLAQVAGHLAQARQALDHAVDEALAWHGHQAAGAISLHRGGLLALPPEVARRLLVAVLRGIGGAEHPPRGADLDRVQAAIAQGRAATLAGCRVLHKGERLWLCREGRAVAGLTTPSDAPWDRRWSLIGPHAPGLEIRALGAGGLALCPDWRALSLPRAVLLATPAIWDQGRLIAAPLAGKPEGWQAICPPLTAACNIAH